MNSFDPKIYCDWNLGVYKFTRPVEIYCDGHFIYTDKVSDAIKIFWINEPKEILSTTYDHAYKNWADYSYVLTWDQDLLDSIPNAVFFRNDTCWLPETYIPTEKQYGISTVIGFKRQTVGHKIRHQLWNQHKSIHRPLKIFARLYGGPDGMEVLGHSKEPLFNYQFHIAIENVRSMNMISEKLIDVCRAKTVPVYWGCPNVEHTFDPRGIIQCTDTQDIIKACNQIDQNTYNSMLPYIEANYQKTFELLNSDRSSKIFETIERQINKI